MKFKGFNFPTFEEWEKNNYYACDYISTFTAEICRTQRNSSFTIPDHFNAYVALKICGFKETFKYIELPTFYFNGATSPKEQIKNWYNDAIKQLNEEFEKFLCKTFFEVPVNNETDKLIIEFSSCIEEADEFINEKGFSSFDEKIQYLKTLFNVEILSKKDSEDITEEQSKEMDYYALLNMIIHK